MGQEFFINSDALQQKVAELLPSQGGAGAGFDLSASTQIVPIIDLTEQAEGSSVRADLQTAFSHDTITSFSISNTTSTIISNTGYFRVFGTYTASGTNASFFSLVDGASSKVLIENPFTGSGIIQNFFDFIVFLAAGQTMTGTSNSANGSYRGSTRQIADITGNLINP